jgi:hypothetical protein
MTGQYEKRDEEFKKWLEEGDIPLPHEPAARGLAEEALRQAFNAGWASRKRVVDYKFN